tara:strand:+ start:570 stop:1208 length:639 start_codon:yes stop_codon:yes gene_type:complete
MSLAPPRTSADTSRTAEFIDAASRLIAEQGYDRTSVRDITQAINLTSGTMFYHFKTKDDLLEAVITKGINDGVNLVNEAVNRAERGSLTRFLALVIAHIGVAHGDLRYVHRVWMREWDRLPAEARARLRPASEKYRHLLDELLLALAADGHIKADPATVRHMLLPALNWTINWTILADERSRTLLGEKIAAVTINQTVETLRSLIRGEAEGS